MTEKYRQQFKSIEDYHQERASPRSRQDSNEHNLVKSKKHKLLIGASHNESNSSSHTSKTHVKSKIDSNKHRYRDNDWSRLTESYRNELKSHEPQESSNKDRHKCKQYPYSPNPGGPKYRKNTDEMLKRYVEDILKMIPDLEEWEIPIRAEARKKLRILVEEELKGKMVNTLNVAEDDLVEI